MGEGQWGADPRTLWRTGHRRRWDRGAPESQRPALGSLREAEIGTMDAEDLGAPRGALSETWGGLGWNSLSTCSLNSNGGSCSLLKPQLIQDAPPGRLDPSSPSQGHATRTPRRRTPPAHAHAIRGPGASKGSCPPSAGLAPRPPTRLTRLLEPTAPGLPARPGPLPTPPLPAGRPLRPASVSTTAFRGPLSCPSVPGAPAPATPPPAANCLTPTLLL